MDYTKFNGRACPSCSEHFWNIAAKGCGGVLKCGGCQQVWKTEDDFLADLERWNERQRCGVAPPDPRDPAVRDRLLRAQARLEALIEQIPAGQEIAQRRWADEYEEVRRSLETTGLDLAEFRISSKDLLNRPDASGVCPPDPWLVETAFLKAKITGLLRYFRSTTEEPPPQIGFGRPTGG